MKHLLLLIVVCISISVYGQVNPNYHKVKGYERDNGTRVEPHHRTDRNKTINDNYTTKPHVNPHNGKVGTISPEPKHPTYSAPTYKAPTPTYKAPAPTYKAPNYSKPTYKAPAPTYKAPNYSKPTYKAPTYKAPSYSTPSYKFK